MFRKLEELVKSDTISAETAALIDGEISIAFKGLKDDREKLKKDNEDLSKSYDEVLKSKDALTEQNADFDKKIAQAKEDGKGELVTQLQSEKDRSIALQDSLNNLQKAHSGLKLDSALSTALKEFDVKKEHLSDTEFRMRSKMSIDESGNTIYTEDDGTVSSVQDGITAHFKGHESKLNPVGGTGSGAGGNGNGGGSNNEKLGDTSESRTATIEARMKAAQ